MRPRFIARLCAVLLCSLSVAAQDTAAPAFEVASVKPATSNLLNSADNFPGGRIEIRGSTLRFLIMQAFDVQHWQIAGGPQWLDSDRFDIDAKPPEASPASKLNPPNRRTPLSPDQRRMLATLLVQRFALKARRETREGTVFRLARGKKELRLKPAANPDKYPWAGGLRGGAITGDGLAGTSETMPDLAWRLSQYMNAPVKDLTGLTSSYDFSVPYVSGDEHPDAIAVILASIEALGLRLEKSNGQVENIVIERAEKPTAN